jgi:hypothetical protein
MAKHFGINKSGKHVRANALRDDKPFEPRDQLIPGGGLTHQERLNRAGAPDLRSANAKLEHPRQGYLRVRPIDADRRHGR